MIDKFGGKLNKNLRIGYRISAFQPPEFDMTVYSKNQTLVDPHCWKPIILARRLWPLKVNPNRPGGIEVLLGQH